MVSLSKEDSKVVAFRIKKMLRQSNTREQLSTTKKYFTLFRKKTKMHNIIDEIDTMIKKHEKKLFPSEEN